MIAPTGLGIAKLPQSDPSQFQKAVVFKSGLSALGGLASTNNLNRDPHA